MDELLDAIEHGILGLQGMSLRFRWVARGQRFRTPTFRRRTDRAPALCPVHPRQHAAMSFDSY